MTDKKEWNLETWKEMEARLSDAEAQIRRLLDERDALINERDAALALEKAKVAAEVRARTEAEERLAAIEANVQEERDNKLRKSIELKEALAAGAAFPSWKDGIVKMRLGEEGAARLKVDLDLALQASLGPCRCWK
jgi:hypothetical protein